MTTQAGYNLGATDGTDPQFGVGDRANICGSIYLYCKATAAAIAAYAICSGANPGAIAEATTTTATALGTAGGLAVNPQFAFAASEYGWAACGPFYLREDGSTAHKVLAANVTAGNLLYSTATAGVLDDDSAGSTIALIGGTLTSTVTTQAATAWTAWRSLGWLK